MLAMMGYRRNAIRSKCHSRAAYATVLALASCRLIACSGGNDHPRALGSGPRSVDYCSAMCSWYRACGQAVSSTCATACWYNGGGMPNYARPEFLTIVADCLQGDIACAGGSDASWQTCVAEAATTITPNQAAFGLCEAFASYFFECGYTETPASCASQFMYYADHTLSQLSSCADSACGDMTSCIEDLIGSP